MSLPNNNTLKTNFSQYPLAIDWKSILTYLLNYLRETNNLTVFETYLRESEAIREGNMVIIHLKSTEAVNLMKSRWHKMVLQAIEKVTGEVPAHVIYTDKLVGVAPTVALVVTKDLM